MNSRQGNLIWLGALLITTSLAGDSRAEALRLKLEDNITPASAEVIDSLLDKAEQQQATVAIISLNTPGGLETSMREIVSRIIASKVPVIVYVSPSGGRAASAGFVILISADIAAMAPVTATGAAHPVRMDGGEVNKTLDEKIVNDASAYVRSLAEKRGRDPQAAESTVRESKSFTEREALEKKLIDLIARDEYDLLAQIDGRPIKRFDGTETSIQTANEKVVDFKPSLRQLLLMALADPRIAYVLFAIGSLCIYFEFQQPGAIVPGVVGVISVVLALYGFHMLPINLTGVVLIAVAAVLFVIEVKVQGFGILGVGGIVAAIIGSLILIDAPQPELRLPLSLVLAVVIPVGLIMMLMLRLAFRAHRAKVSTGTSGMVGLRGRAETEIAPEGTVFVRGELWKARSQMRIAPGEPIRVLNLNGLTLEVEVDKDGAVVPKRSGQWVAPNEH